MATTLYMPKWGSAMTQGKVLCWLKEEEEEIEMGEALVEIETEKINNLVEAPVSGKIRKILVREGEVAPVGHPIAVITLLDEQWDGQLPEPQTIGAGSHTAGQDELLQGNHFPEGTEDGSIRKAVTPAAKSLTKKRGIDLEKIAAVKSRIVVSDVLAYMAEQTGWPNSRFAQVGENLIHYLDMGQGFPLLLLHGLGASCSAWQPNLHFLSDHFRVIAPDLPGSGLSDKPEVSYNPEFFVGFLQDFLDYMGIERCILLGNSFGGMIAASFAARFPDKLSGLILEDSAGLGREVESELKRALLESRDKEGIRDFLTLLFQDTKFIFPGVVEEMFKFRQQPEDFAALKSAIEHSLDQAGQLVDLSHRLADLSMPTLVVWGAVDRIIPLEHGIKAAQALVKGELKVYEDCGHCPHIEAAARFNQDVLSFAARLAG